MNDRCELCSCKFSLIVLIALVWLVSMLSFVFAKDQTELPYAIIGGIFVVIAQVCLTVVIVSVLRNKHLEEMRKHAQNDLFGELVHKKNWDAYLLTAEKQRSELRVEEKTKLQVLELEKKRVEHELKLEEKREEQSHDLKKMQLGCELKK